jgi:hypothetical protein
LTENEFHNYLLVIGIFSAVLGVVNLVRPNRRWLGAGAILLGVGAFLYASGVPKLVVGIVCGFGVYSLGKDVASRTGSRA